MTFTRKAVTDGDVFKKRLLFAAQRSAELVPALELNWLASKTG
jgi:hypothetical protein